MGRKKKDYSNGYSGADLTFGSDPFAAPNQSKTPNGYSWTDVVDETGRDKKNASKTTTASQTQSKTSSRPKKKKPGFEAALERMNRHIQNRRGAPLSMIGQRNTTNVCSA